MTAVTVLVMLRNIFDFESAIAHVISTSRYSLSRFLRFTHNIYYVHSPRFFVAFVIIVSRSRVSLSYPLFPSLIFSDEDGDGFLVFLLHYYCKRQRHY